MIRACAALSIRSWPVRLRVRPDKNPGQGGDAMNVETYLFFDGRCDEALEFYRKHLGAEVTMLMRFKDSPEPHQPGMIPPGAENKVMHASFRVGDTTVMASDRR